MLTRRIFLTTIAAAPLAKFCKTEPVRPYDRHITSRIVLKNGTVLEFFHSDATAKWTDADSPMWIDGYALPQGTLG